MVKRVAIVILSRIVDKKHAQHLEWFAIGCLMIILNFLISIGYKKAIDEEYFGYIKLT